MNKEIKININSCGLLSTLLTVAFVVLKLCGVISWTWFMVFLPIIINVALIILILIVVSITLLIAHIRN